MLRTACFSTSFKWPKRGILDQFSGKTPYNRTTVFQNVSVLYDRYILFLEVFDQKKEHNVRFQTDFYGKPNIIERQFSQNVTVLYVRYSVFF